MDLCELRRDIEMLNDGDMCLLGEGGFTLSGGQKARVCLARTIYYEADIYLFDDPFSALDLKVGGVIFEKLILDHLKHKTRILVTHQTAYMEHVLIFEYIYINIYVYIYIYIDG